ncbi:MAG: hypothetical protein AAFP76_03215 [Bacteroidota bacterium]
MKIAKRILIGLVVLVIAFCVFAVWYKNTYSMEVVSPYAVNDAHLPTKLLVATQGSEFKDQITASLVNRYHQDSVYISVIDVSSLKDVKPEDYKAIIVMHTWENWKPPRPVEEFVDRTKAYSDKIIVLTTSGEGSYRMEEVDALTGASIIKHAEDYSDEIIFRIEKLLKN